MNYYKKLSPEGDGGASSAQTEDKLDVKALKEELLNSNKQMAETLYSNIMDSVKSMIDGDRDGRKDAEKTVSADQTKKGHNMVVEDLSEFENELAALGIRDEEQADAFLKIVNKALRKSADGVENKIIQKVTSRQNNIEKKKVLEQDIRAKFPDIANQNSALFKESRRVWNEEMSEATQQTPEATALAVSKAAANLGIAPISRQDFYENDAHLQGGGNNNANLKKRNNEPNEKMLEFANYFGIKKDLFSQKLKEVKGRYMEN